MVMDSHRHIDARTEGYPDGVSPYDLVMRSINATLITCLVVLALTILGGMLRWGFMDHPMRYDESFSYLRFASQGPWYVATHYEAPNNHILHNLMVWASAGVFGSGPVALRLPAFAAGVLIIPATAWLAWSLFRRRAVAIIAAIAVCVSSPLIEYAANSRGYSLVTLLTIVMIICTVDILRSPNRLIPWLLWALLGAVGAFTVPIMLYPVAGLSLAMLVTGIRASDTSRRQAVLRRFPLALGLCGLITLLLYLPLLLSAGVGATLRSADLAASVFNQQVGTVGNMVLATAHAWTRDAGLLWVVLLSLGILRFLTLASRKLTTSYLLPVVMLGGAAAIVLAQGQVLAPRALMFGLPVVLVCASRGLCGLFTRDGQADARPMALQLAPVCVLLVAAGLSASSVRQREYLCSEPDTLVDVERIVDEYRDFGADRSSLLVRYTPATRYYLLRNGLASPIQPEAAGVERVYIVEDRSKPLPELWHRGVEGYELYGPPRVWREFSRCTMYAADRLQRCESDTTKHVSDPLTGTAKSKG